MKENPFVLLSEKVVVKDVAAAAASASVESVETS